jgi:hypothetical protein
MTIETTLALASGMAAHRITARFTFFEV